MANHCTSVGRSDFTNYFASSAALISKQFKRAGSNILFLPQIRRLKLLTQTTGHPFKLTMQSSCNKASLTTSTTYEGILCCYRTLSRGVEDRSTEVVMQTCEMSFSRSWIFDKKFKNQIYRGFYPNIQVCRQLPGIHQWLQDMGLNELECQYEIHALRLVRSPGANIFYVYSYP